jgi:E3 ubiquitin-protein ligase HUWE1
MHHLINDFLCPSSRTDLSGSTAAKKKEAVAKHARRLLLALVTTTGEVVPVQSESGFGIDDGDADLLFVRNFVLDILIKAYEKVAAGEEPPELRYARMDSLARLMDGMMLDNDAKPARQSQQPSELPHRHLPRLMYEKGYLEKLTTSIVDIDISVPEARQTIERVLGVLRRLTATAKELSQHNIIPTTSLLGTGDHDDDLESHSSVSDTDMHGGREETPDLYRNSALGMLEPADDEGDEDDESGDEEGE